MTIVVLSLENDCTVVPPSWEWLYSGPSLLRMTVPWSLPLENSSVFRQVSFNKRCPFIRGLYLDLLNVLRPPFCKVTLGQTGLMRMMMDLAIIGTADSGKVQGGGLKSRPDGTCNQVLNFGPPPPPDPRTKVFEPKKQVDSILFTMSQL